MGSSKKHHRDSDSDDHDRRRHHKKSKHKDDKQKDENKLPSSIKPINKDDYYEKSSEFRIWLKEKKRKFFTDLEKDDARYYFKKFVKAWNAYELDDKFYKGINSSKLDSGDSTSYKWAFAKNIDAFEMDRVKHSVNSMTVRGAPADGGPIGREPASSSSSKRRSRPVGPSMPSGSSSSKTAADLQLEREEEEEREQQRRRAERRSRNKEAKDYVESVVPKLDGREARLAEKRATNAMRRQEASLDVELNDADLYGGGDDFKARLAQERRRQEQRQARREEAQQQRRGPVQDRLQQFKSKEAETMQMLRALAEQQKARGGL
ncbi:hypothetical protein BC940DRAFT_306468 [Gongronella butleri]|nr:hypothetical protein BC940DRAFT_306468 [Gongronella butleri]